MLRISVDKVRSIVTLARDAFGREPEEGTVVHVDGEADGLPLPSSEDYDAAAGDALFDYVDALNGDEVADLLALLWLGRGDHGRGEWPGIQSQADEAVGDGDVVAEVLQDPSLPADLAAGLEALGYDCPEE